MYDIRTYQPKDRESLSDLIVEVWPGAAKDTFNSRWWWNCDPSPIIVAVESTTGTIAAVCAQVEFSMYFGGEVADAAWLVDLFVSRSHQGKGIGKARKGLGQSVARFVMEANSITATLSQTKAAVKTLQRMGWSDRQTAKLYVNPFFAVPGIAWPFRFLSSGVQAIEIALFDLTVEKTPVPELNQIWGCLRDMFDVLSVRNAEKLLKRYASRPERHYQLLIASRGGRPCGYMIFRICPSGSVRSLNRFPYSRMPIGLVVDFLVAPLDTDVFSRLLDSALFCMAKAGAGSILCLSTVSEFHGALVRRGFLHGDTPGLKRQLTALNVGFMHFAKPDLATRTGHRWFLTLGDCDMDLTWGESLELKSVSVMP